MLRGRRVLITQIQLANSALEAGPADQGTLKWRDA
jgi:hypothetical protein